MVAALIPNVGHSIFAETIQGLQEGLRGTGHELLLASTDYSLEREEAQLRAVIGWSPAALIVTGRNHTSAALRLLKDARDAGTPVIEIWDWSHGDDAAQFCQIGFDHEAVGRAMAQHLVERGHRRLAYVGSSVAEDYRAHERGEGFARAARAAGAQVKLLRAPAGDVFDAGREMLGVLRSPVNRRFTAAAFANDHIACGALMEAQARGVAVPGELAVLGFGDFPLGRQVRPSLSTVRPPRAEIGRAAAGALLRAVETGEEAVARSLPWELIARDSTR
jgi:LacI family gluconate utilization system Gnt-I transcriptional repressor